MSRKIIVRLAMSADGFIARPDGSVDWLDRPRPKDFYGMNEFYQSIDTILLGRKTYEVAMAFQKQGKVASVFDPKLKHYVFSRTLSASDLAPGVAMVQEPVASFAAGLREEPGKDIWMMGGGEIIGAFLDEGQIDEFAISVVPCFIGEGIPLLAPRHRHLLLQLLACKSYPDGVVTLHYSCGR
jgi:dihydrofolate reductase